MTPLDIIISVAGFGPSAFQAYRIIKKSKKIISRDPKQTSINLLKILFYEPFLIHDGIKLLVLKVDKRNKIIKSKGSKFY